MGQLELKSSHLNSLTQALPQQKVGGEEDKDDDKSSVYSFGNNESSSSGDGLLNMRLENSGINLDKK